MKKFLILLLCFGLMISAFAACNPQTTETEETQKEETVQEETQEEPTKEASEPLFDFEDNHFTLFMPGQNDPLELDGDITQLIMEKQGIVWDSVEVGNGSSVSEQINLKLAGNQLSDVIGFSSDETIWGRLISEEAIIQMDNYFTDAERFPNLAKIDTRVLDFHKFSDGHNYYVPGGYEPILEEPSGWQGKSHGLKVRVDYLEKVGMTKDDIKTLEGYEAFLRAIKGTVDGDGQEVIPMALGGENFRHLAVVMAMFGTLEWNEQPDGSVLPDYQTQGFKDMWQWLNKMYTEGLLDAETTYQKNDLWKEKYLSLRYASVFTNSNDDIKAIMDEIGFDRSGNYKEFLEFGIPEVWVEPVPLPKVGGYDFAPFATYNPFGSSGTAITINCSNPDLVMKALDWMQTNEAYNLMEWGPEEFGAYELVDGVPKSNETVFQSADFWGGGKAKVTERGFWWWKNVAGPALTHFPFIESPWIAENAFLVMAEDINREQGTFTYDLKWERIKAPIDGSIVKYDPIQYDLRKQYYAKMCMAETPEDFEAAYAEFLAEMKATGHDEETISEFNALYAAYSETPAGKIEITVEKYIPRNVFGDGPVVTGGD